MKTYKILLKEQKQENKWGYEEKGQIHEATVAFDFKNDEMELKKGDIVYYHDDFPRKLTIDSEEYLSTNPSAIVCQK